MGAPVARIGIRLDYQDERAVEAMVAIVFRIIRQEEASSHRTLSGSNKFHASEWIHTEMQNLVCNEWWFVLYLSDIFFLRQRLKLPRGILGLVILDH